MNRLPAISGKEFVKLLVKYGCVLVGVNGSHFKVENPANNKRSIIPVHGNKVMNRGFMLDILRNQLGIDVVDFMKFIS